MNLEKQVEKLQSGKRKSKLRALVQLGTLGAKASAAVVIVENLLTTDGDEQIRATAAQALLGISSASALGSLRSAAEDESAMVRGSVAVALFELGDKELSRELLTRMTDSRDPIERQWGEHYSGSVDLTACTSGGVANAAAAAADEPIASTTNGAVWNRQANEWEIHITNEYLGTSM
jgi:HEAT repeat protein